MFEAIKKRWLDLHIGEGLRSKVLVGGVWLGGGAFVEQSMRFARNMLLARVLAPEAFGTMAIVTSAASIIHTIMDIGVREALIQNPRGAEREYIGAAWWMAFGRSVSFWLTLCLIAPFIAHFYGNPELAPLFRICATGLLFDGAMSARAYVAIKEMKFPRWAMINHGGAIFGVFVTVFLSFLMRDVWALAIGYGAESLGRFVLSYVVCPYIPPVRWNRDAVRDLFKFSKNVFGLSLLNLVFARSDVFVIAKLRSAADLGLYTMAVYLVQTPAAFLMNVLGQTIMPSFAKIQSNKPRMNRILLQVTSAIILVGTPLLVFVAFYGKALLTLVYGSRYGIGAAPLIIASVVAILNLVNGQITSVFFATGRPEMHRTSILMMASTMALLVYPSVLMFGPVGGQLACLAAILAGFLFQLHRVHVLTELDLTAYVRIFLKASVLAVVVAAVCFAVRNLALPLKPIPNLVCGVIGCLMVYGAAYPMFRQILSRTVPGEGETIASAR